MASSVPLGSQWTETQGVALGWIWNAPSGLKATGLPPTAPRAPRSGTR
jgi:hypothetical protein